MGIVPPITKVGLGIGRGFINMLKIILLVCLLLVTAFAAQVPDTQFVETEKCNLDHNTAKQRVNAAGIPVVSSGNCEDRNRPQCTSLQGIRCRSIDGILTLRSASNCPIRITGGTETGHGNPNGQWSHWNGWRLDISLSPCLQSYISANFQYIGRRPGDNAEQWKSSSGNIYARERDHWDIIWLW
jgi:hypothetical protein